MPSKGAKPLNATRILVYLLLIKGELMSVKVKFATQRTQRARREAIIALVHKENGSLRSL